MIHLPYPRACPCGVVHRAQRGDAAFEALLAQRPYFATVTSAWTNPNSLDRTTGQSLRQTDWEGALGNLLYLFGTTGAAVTFTPTLTQSVSVSTSTASGHYVRLGKLVLAQISLVASSAGTAANGIVIGGLPVNQSNDGFPHALGYFSRGGPPGTLNYVLVASFATSTTMSLISGAAATGAFGVNPAVTLASGDVIGLTVFYEGP